MSRCDYLQKDDMFRLRMALEVVDEAYPEAVGIILVGSVLERPDYRDVDVRCILLDEDFDALFPGLHGNAASWHPRFSLTCFSISAWLRHLTGLPVDFQFQRMTQANEKYAGKPRNGMSARVSAPDAA